MLDFSPLRKALAQLEQSLDFAQNAKAKKDMDLYRIGRTAAIQCFEYSYELTHKMLRRHLEHTEHSGEEVDHLTFQDVLRLAAERGLLDNPKEWFEFRKKRNKTSHGYDEDVAEAIYCELPAFMATAKTLLERMEKRHVSES